MRASLTWLIHLAVTTLGTIMMSSALIHVYGGLFPPGEHLFLLSSCALLSTVIVLVPYTIKYPDSLPHQLYQVLSAGMSIFFVISWQTPLSPLSPMLWQITVGVSLLTFTLTAIAGLFTKLTDSYNNIICWIVLLLLITASTPLWLGPAVELFYFDQFTSNLIIVISPLSYLATLSEWDYLRGEWFYHYTPFGGLRFDYPSIPITSLVYLTIGLVCHYIRKTIKSDKFTADNRTKYQSSVPI